MALVENRHPHLLSHLKGLSPLPVDPEHPDNFKFRGMWLHDMEKPGAECQNHFTIIPENRPGTVITTGMGLGHGICDLVQQRPHISHFFIFELYPEIFLQALHQKDLRSLLSDFRVHIHLGMPEHIRTILTPAIRTLRLENAYSLLHLPSFQMDTDGYETLRKEIFDEINNLNVSGATLMQYGEIFFQNRMNVLPLFQRHHLLEELAGAFHNIPAILVAGGPSLNHDLDVLHQCHGKCILFAVDTVLPVLAARGIVPDFVSSLDYDRITYEKFADTAKDLKNKVNLIAMPFLCTKIPKVFPFKEIYWAFMSAKLEKWFNQLIGGSMENGGAGTVAHMNLIAAITLGCSPITLVGQDLAYTDESSSHAGNVAIADKKGMKNTLASGESLVVPTNNGGKALTSRGYYSYITTFESMIKANPGNYINATIPGAVIEGTEVMPLEQVLHTFCTKQLATDEIMEKKLAASFWQRNFRKTEKTLTNQLRNVRKLLGIVKKGLDDGLKASQDVKKLIKAGKTHANLNSLPASLRSLILKVHKTSQQADKDKVWSLLEDLTLHGLKVSERMQAEIDRLAHTGPYLEWLDKSLERINEISRVRFHWLGFFEEKIHSSLTEMEGDPVYHPEKYTSLPDEIRYYQNTGNLRFAYNLLERMNEEEKNSPEIIFLEGQTAAIHTDYEKAHTCFSSLKNTPQEANVHRFRDDWANEYADHAEWTLALSGTSPTLRMLGKGLAMAPDHPRLQQLLTRIFRMDLATMRQGTQEGKELLEEWSRWLEGTPGATNFLPDKDHAFFLDRCAEAAKENGFLQEAVRLVQLAAERHDTAIRRIRTMEFFFELDDFEAGLIQLEKAVRLDPAAAVHWEQVGEKLEQNGHETIALEAYQKGMEALPEYPPFYLRAGRILLVLGHIEKARLCLGEYGNLMKEKPESITNSALDDAEMFLQRGEHENALAILLPLQSPHNENARFWHLLGNACQKAGHAQDAEHCFRRAVFLQSDFAQAHYHLGLLFHENGHPDEAEESYRTALKHKPDFEQAHTNLGVLAFQKNNLKSAADHFEKAIDINPMDANAHFNYAKVMELLGERQKALRAYKVCTEINPLHPKAQSAREYLLQNKSI